MLKVFSHYFPSHTLQQAVFDAVLLFLAVLLAVGLEIHGSDIDWPLIVPSALVFALLMILLNSIMGLYRPAGAGFSGRDALVRVLFAILISVPVALAVFRLASWDEFATQGVQISVVVLLGLILTMRGFVNRRSASSIFLPRVLIIGTGSDAAAVARSLTHPVQRGVQIVGFVPAGTDDEMVIDAKQLIPADGRLPDLVKRLKVNEIIVAVRERRGGVLPIRELLDCKVCGVKILDLSSFFEGTQGQVRIDSLKASWLIYGDGFRQGVARGVVKRCFDICVAAGLLLLALPVMLFTALLILLEDGAPVFYRQERVGQGGRIFKVMKFRSMRTDAEKDGKPRWASSNDDRVTRVGRVIRKCRIDELPQLFNVITGEMSLVGPRPERAYFVDQLAQEIPFYAVRHCVKPGVTGWAQVRYQYGASVEDSIQKLQYDLYYVKNHSLMLDILVLCETVRVVLTGEGAH